MNDLWRIVVASQIAFLLGWEVRVRAASDGCLQCVRTIDDLRQLQPPPSTAHVQPPAVQPDAQTDHDTPLAASSDRAAVPRGTAATCVKVLGYYEPGDGGGGDFYWDAESTKADDCGMIHASNGFRKTNTLQFCTKLYEDAPLEQKASQKDYNRLGEQWRCTPSTGPQKGRWVRLHDNGPISVLWFGARPNDDFDDHHAIQAAIDSLPKESGGCVFFPPGIYNIMKTIEICRRDNVTLLGSGSGVFSWEDGVGQTQPKQRLGTTLAWTLPAENMKGNETAQVIRIRSSKRVNLANFRIRGGLDYDVNTTGTEHRLAKTGISIESFPTHDPDATYIVLARLQVLFCQTGISMTAQNLDSITLSDVSAMANEDGIVVDSPTAEIIRCVHVEAAENLRYGIDLKRGHGGTISGGNFGRNGQADIHLTGRQQHCRIEYSIAEFSNGFILEDGPGEGEETTALIVGCKVSTDRKDVDLLRFDGNRKVTLLANYFTQANPSEGVDYFRFPGQYNTLLDLGGSYDRVEIIPPKRSIQMNELRFNPQALRRTRRCGSKRGGRGWRETRWFIVWRALRNEGRGKQCDHTFGRDCSAPHRPVDSTTQQTLAAGLLKAWLSKGIREASECTTTPARRVGTLAWR